MTGAVHSRMDTSAFPEESRFELFRTGLGATHDAERLPDDASFAACIDAWLLGDMIITAGTQGGARVVRSAARARADGFDYFTFTCIQAGATGTGVAGQPIRFGPQEVAVFDLSQPMDVSVGANRNICVRLSRATLRAALRPLPDLHGRVLSGTAGRMVSDHFATLLRHVATIPAADIPLVVRATAGLVATCLDAADSAMGDTAANTPEPALCGRAQRFIEANLALPGLGPAMLCEALSASRSSLYRAFDGAAGVAAYIRARRLETAYARLREEAGRGTLSQVARDCGFNSGSQFSRAFRDRFGVTPRDARLLDGPSAQAVVLPDAYARWLAGLERFGHAAV